MPGLLPEFAGVDRLEANPGCCAIAPTVLHQIERDAAVNQSFACNGFRQALRSKSPLPGNKLTAKPIAKITWRSWRGCLPIHLARASKSALPPFLAESISAFSMLGWAKSIFPLRHHDLKASATVSTSGIGLGACSRTKFAQPNQLIRSREKPRYGAVVREDCFRTLASSVPASANKDRLIRNCPFMPR